MVTDQQVRRLLKLIQTEKTQAMAAAKAGMDSKTARKYLRSGKLPSEGGATRRWRTPFDEVWEQVRQQLELNPGLQHIGAILGDGHEQLLTEARKAADSAGLTLHHRTARSDRETLYLFNRLAPDIDGFWLFPDNRILSPSVLRQMLSYASRHRVQVAVFNPALLEFGAALSATSVNSDIAETVVSVAHRVIRGDGKSIPTVTPLNEIKVQTNDAVIKTSKVAAANGDGTQ